MLAVVMVLPSLVAAGQAVGVIVAANNPDLATIAGDDERPASLFAVIQPGERVLVAPGGKVTIRYAGEDVEVSPANSPYRLPVEASGDTVAGNMLDWALSVLGATDAEREEPLTVAMASRGFQSLSLYYVSPFDNRLQRRDQMILIHERGAKVDSVRVDGFGHDLPLTPGQAGMTVVDMRALPAGNYLVHVCAGQRCLPVSLNWMDPLQKKGGEVSVLPELAALALIRDGDGLELEGVQQLWSIRASTELASALFTRLIPVE